MARRTTIYTGLDGNAQQFLDAAGITSGSIISAINKLVLNLKGIGPDNSTTDFWIDEVVFKPYAGGNSTAHSYNLINPFTYQSTFFGSVTHTSNGITGNGSNAYENQNIAPNALSQNDFAMGFYCRTNNNANVVDMGNNASGLITYIEARSGADAFGIRVNSSAFNVVTNLDSRGLFAASRIVSGFDKGYKNGVLLLNSARTSSAPSSLNIFTMAWNVNGSPSAYTTRNYACSFVRKGFKTDADATLYYNIIQQYQTDMGRNV
jgi:hypothetical protein